MFDERRLLSQPAGVEWAGWRSDTLALQRNGWQLSVHMDYAGDTYRLAMHHQGLKLYAVAIGLSVHELSARHQGSGFSKYPVFRVQAVAPRIESAAVSGMDFAKFQPIDATPTYVTGKVQRIEDFNIFRVVGRTEEVLVDKADMTVIEHLEAIKRLQSPKQKELRQKMFARSEPEGPKQELVAQLVTYSAAA